MTHPIIEQVARMGAMKEAHLRRQAEREKNLRERPQALMALARTLSLPEQSAERPSPYVESPIIRAIRGG